MKKVVAKWYEQPESMSKIKEIEKEIGYNFPDSYIKLVSTYDSLTPVEEVFDFINIYGKPDERDINFCSFKEEYKNSFILDEQSNINDLDNFGIPYLVVFGFSANGDYVCFDYRDNPAGNNPKVVLVYHDDYIENEDGTNSMVVNFVANSFKEFMDDLYDYDDVYDEDGQLKPTGIFYGDKEIFKDQGFVDIKIIENFEKEIGLNLPNEYKNLISKHNSVRFIHSTLKFTDYYGNIKEISCYFYGFNCTGKTVDLIKNQSIMNIKKYGVDNLIAFAQSNNGDIFCFDYRQNKQEPNIVLVYIDVFEKNNKGESQMVINFVANTFEEFMDMLHK